MCTGVTRGRAKALPQQSHACSCLEPSLLLEADADPLICRNLGSCQTVMKEGFQPPTNTNTGYLPFADELDDPTEVCTAVFLGLGDRLKGRRGRLRNSIKPNECEWILLKGS